MVNKVLQDELLHAMGNNCPITTGTAFGKI